MKSLNKILHELFDGKYRNLKLWQTDAKNRGLKTRIGVSPDGEHSGLIKRKIKEN